MFLWMKKIVDAFFGKQWCSRRFRKCRCTLGAREFQVGASGSPTACHEDSGEDGAFHVLLMLESDTVDPQSSKASQILQCQNESMHCPRRDHIIEHHQRVTILQDKLCVTCHRLESKRFPPTDPFDIKITWSRGWLRRNKEKRQKCHMCVHAFAETRDHPLKVH